MKNNYLNSNYILNGLYACNICISIILGIIVIHVFYS